ncbi:replication protein P [Lonsdalea quercina]|uniref:replication protein P n=1 Tax=Lonsdalea quercina TaxID=71657 RepID=UPI003974D771
MNKITTAIQNRDLNALSRMMQPEPQARVINGQAESLVDALFKNLMQTFPAARQTALSTPEDIAAAKRQWILAFAENGITTLEQVRAGMRIARQQETDFWPSVGKFIGWCRAGAAANAGLPDLDEVMSEFRRYSATRDRYASAETFPWSAPIMYWIVLDVRRLMYQHNYTEGEIRKSIQRHLNHWAARLAKGDCVPAPVVRISDQRREPSPAQVADASGEYRRAGEEFIGRIRAQNGGASC